jgi:hypothetical protein
MLVTVTLTGFGFLTGDARASTLRVPEDYATVNDAVAGASAGDSILVGPGTYESEFDVTVPLTILSSDGPQVTTLTGQEDDDQWGDHRIIPNVLAGLVLRGLTFRDAGNGSPFPSPLFIAGVMRVYPGANVIAEDCRFLSSRSGTGSAIHSTGANLTLRDCRFEDLWANGRGGAIRFGGSGAVLIERCVFTRCSGTLGGAINFASVTSSMVVRDCVFERNRTNEDGGQWGGAIAASGEGSLLVENCDFLENTTDDGGGAMYIYHVQQASTIRNCLFARNVNPTTLDPFIGGGALWIEEMAYGAGLTFENCTFALNEAPRGSVAMLIENTASLQRPRFRNCIIFGNVGSLFMCGIPGFSVGAVDIDCSIIYGNQSNAICAGTVGPDVLNVDPLFCDDVGFELCDTSPAILATCGPMGARGVGCSGGDCPIVPVETMSWGAIKDRFATGARAR